LIYDSRNEFLLIIDGVTVVTECKGLRIGAESSEAALSCRIGNLLYACVSLTAGYRYGHRLSRSFELAARG